MLGLSRSGSPFSVIFVLPWYTGIFANPVFASNYSYYITKSTCMPRIDCSSRGMPVQLSVSKRVLGAKMGRLMLLLIECRSQSKIGDSVFVA